MAFWRAAGHGTRRVWLPLLAFAAVVATTVAPGGAALPALPPLPLLPLPSPGEARLVVEPASWDFGDIDLNQGLGSYNGHRFVIRNDGTLETDELCFRLTPQTGSPSAFGFPGGGTGFCSTVRLGPGETVEQEVLFGYGSWDGPTGEQRGRLEIVDRSENGGVGDVLAAADVTGRALRHGYWLATDGGTVVARNGAPHFSDARGLALPAPISALAPTPTGSGYWLAGADGSVYGFGDAEHFGSADEFAPNAPVIAMAAHPTGAGYWLVAEDGGVFTFGEAQFHGSLAEEELYEPVVALVATPSGDGYWLATTDGGVFPFGDAEFFGATDDVELSAPILSMAATPSGDGYWVVSASGAVFPFGAAQYYGSPQEYETSHHPVFGITSSRSGAGYWLTATDGRVFHHGDATPSYDGADVGSRDGEPNIVVDIDAAPSPPRHPEG